MAAETVTMLDDTQVGLIIAIGVVAALIIALVVGYCLWIRGARARGLRKALDKFSILDPNSEPELGKLRKTFPQPINPYLKVVQQPLSRLPTLPLVSCSKVVPHPKIVPDREVEAVVVTES